MFIDTHTHVTDEAFRGGEEAVVERAVAAGVGKMLLADTGSEEREPMFAACGRHPGVLYPMLGLHPENVKGNWQDELAELEDWLPKRPVAIGEIGLDYHWDVTFKEQQKEALRAQFELAARLNLPVNIHLRDATEDFLAVVRGCAHLHLRGNMHAFSGSLETWKELCRWGDWSVGIGGVVTFKKAHLPEVVKEIPLNRILLETDAPYMAPVPLRGSRNEPANIPLIAAKVAEIKGMTFEETADITRKNAMRFYGIDE